MTVLGRNNNGVYPFDRVYQIIDGRQEVKTHGPCEMPIWRSRILALTEYIYRLQAK